MIKNVIFDMDGTILDTLEDLCDSVNYALSSVGVANVTIDEVRSFVGDGMNLLVERALKDNFNQLLWEQCLKIFKAHYEKNKENKTAPYDGILQLMKELNGIGINMAVVSNKHDSAVKELTHKFFGQYINVAIGVSENIAPKPSPNGVYLAMEWLGASKADTVYIGDSDVDFATARNSHLPFVGVTWGFRSKQLLQDLGTLHIADKPIDIFDILTIPNYAIVGNNLTHSLSPLMHTKLFEASGVRANYLKFDIENIENFLPIAEGLNVTIPHKQSIIHNLKGVDDFAKYMGAVNCITNDKIGYNTDYYGFLASFKQFYTSSEGKILLLGYGGVGRVIAKALSNYNVTIAVKDMEKSQSIERETGMRVLDINAVPDEKFDVIVNATPVGMYPKIDNCPIGKEVIANSDYVYDAIYNPVVTELMKIALSQGKKVKSGVDMLVYQAVEAHKIWYNAIFTEQQISDTIKCVGDSVRSGKW